MELQTVGGYRLEEELGSGGMGVVYKAHDARGRAVAVKVLHPNIANDASARVRLAREVRTLQRISHPRIAAVLDAQLEAEHPFIVTEFVDGATLSEDVRTGGPFTESELVHFGHALIDALHSVHGAGVIHRDLKPANVMMSDGEPVVIDFGIAQAADEVKVTVTGLVMGTPGYLSPELVEGAASTEATDWWGWGATMAYAATGRSPFGGGGIDAVIARVATGKADLEGCPERFVPVIMAALCPDPLARPHGEELLEALVDIEEGRMPGLPVFQPFVPGPPEVPGGTAVMPRTRPAQPPSVPAPREFERPNYGALEPPHSPQPVQAVVPQAVAPVQAQLSAGPVHPGYPQSYGAYGQPLAHRAGGGWLSFAAVCLATACAAVYPVLMIGVAYVWQLLARSSGKVSRAAHQRRAVMGPGSDRWTAMTSGPPAFIGSIFTSLFALILPLLAAAAVFILLHLDLMQPAGAQLSETAEFALSAAVFSAVLWWGPGSANLREGTRIIASAAVGRSSAAGGIAAIVLLVLAACVLGFGLSTGVFDLWPLYNDVLGDIPQSR